MIRVKSDLASAMVILAHPSSSEDELKKQLEEISKSYEIRHFTSISRLPGGYVQGLGSMIARLENFGFTRTGHFRNLSSLTESGVGILEKAVLDAFIEDPHLTGRFAADVGLDLASILQKYIKEYLGLKEEQVYGRRFSSQSS